jgi:Tfp pilus assembly protein PilF
VLILMNPAQVSRVFVCADFRMPTAIQIIRLAGNSLFLVFAILAMGCESKGNGLPAKSAISTSDSPLSSAGQATDQSPAPSDPLSQATPATAASKHPSVSPIADFSTLDGERSRFTVKGGNRGQSFSRHLDRGGRFFNSREFAEAAKEFEAAVAADPRDARGHYYLGLAYLELGKPSNSIRHFDRALNMAPDHVESLLGRASAYLREQRFRKAQDDCDEVIKRDPDNSRALTVRATCMFQLGEFESARVDASHSLEIAPDSMDAYFIRCVSNARLKLLDEAKADYDQAVKLGLPENLAAVAQSYLKPSVADAVKSAK